MATVQNNTPHPRFNLHRRSQPNGGIQRNRPRRHMSNEVQFRQDGYNKRRSLPANISQNAAAPISENIGVPFSQDAPSPISQNVPTHVSQNVNVPISRNADLPSVKQGRKRRVSESTPGWRPTAKKKRPRSEGDVGTVRPSHCSPYSGSTEPLPKCEERSLIRVN